MIECVYWDTSVEPKKWTKVNNATFAGETATCVFPKLIKNGLFKVVKTGEKPNAVVPVPVD